MIYQHLEHPLINYLNFRSYHSYNSILVIVGENRTGKSYMALALAYMLDNNFNTDHIIFTFKEFLQFVKAQKSCWIIFDEIGLTASGSEWWSLENRLIGYITQSFGRLNINLIMTLPSLNMLSRQGFAMTTIVIRMLKRRVGRVYKIIKDPIKGKLYPYTIGHIRIGNIPKDISLPYERKKINFLHDKSAEWEKQYNSYMDKMTTKFTPKPVQNDFDWSAW
jgi:hypothetical protein